MVNELDLLKMGDNIKLLRKRIGISQTRLAERIAVSQTHLSNIENGNIGISLNIACKIANVLHCSIDELVYGLRPDQRTDLDTPLSLCPLGNFIDAMKQCVKQGMQEYDSAKAKAAEAAAKKNS